MVPSHTCRICGASAGKHLTFCPTCGARALLSVEYNSRWQPPSQSPLKKLLRSLSPSGQNAAAYARRWEKMTPFGSRELEAEIEALRFSVRASTAESHNARVEELTEELATALTIRAGSEATDLRRYRTASLTCSAAVRIDSENPTWRIRRAGIYKAWAESIRSPFMGILDREDNDDPDRLASLAEEDYSAALALDPRNTEALVGRASLGGQLQESDEDCRAALGILARAIEADKNDGDSLEERASIFARLNLNDKAIEDYTAAYELASTSPRTVLYGFSNSYKLQTIRQTIQSLRERSW